MIKVDDMIKFNDEDDTIKCEHEMCHIEVTRDNEYFKPVTVREFKKLGTNKLPTEHLCSEHAVGRMKVHR
jgi:hypothetical protein